MGLLLCLFIFSAGVRIQVVPAFPPLPDCATRSPAVTIARTQQWSFSFSYSGHSAFCKHGYRPARQGRSCICRHISFWPPHHGRSFRGHLPTDAHSSCCTCRPPVRNTARSCHIAWGYSSGSTRGRNQNTEKQMFCL